MPEQTLSVEQTLAQRLSPLVANRQFNSGTIKPHQAEVDRLTKEIKRLMLDEAGETECVVETGDKHYKVTINPYAERNSISRELLIQHGVTAEIVNACTVTTYYEKIDVREVKGDE